MKLNTLRLLAAQRILRARINEEHPNKEPKENREKFRVVANIIELAEAFNEERSFKFWSNRRKPTENLLEEFIDSLHFFIDTAIDYGWEGILHSVAEAFDEVRYKNEGKLSVDYFLELVYNLSAIEVLPKRTYNMYERAAFNANSRQEVHFTNAWILYLALSANLDFTYEQMESMYFEKNRINLERQASGY